MPKRDRSACRWARGLGLKDKLIDERLLLELLALAHVVAMPEGNAVAIL
jgi:hypothetical protein